MSVEIDWNSLQLPVSETVKTYSTELQQDIFQYLQSLDEHTRKAYCIAYEHLGTSFSVSRSNGFISWLKTKKST